MSKSIKYPLIFLLPCVLHMGEVNAQSNTRPNVLIINIDDMGFKDVGYMGSRYYETPNIDRLSKQGMVFTNAYAAAANCAPSRACLMSGENTPRHGIYTVGNSARGKSKFRKLIPTPNTEVLADSFLTIPEVLRADGYTTCHVGKWHLGADPRTQGFDRNIGGAEYGHPQSYFSPYHNRMLKDGAVGENLTDRLTEEAMAFLDSVNNKPFFMYYATYAVHEPLQAKADLIEKYKKKSPDQGQANAIYAAMIDNLDQNIGKLIQKLHSLHKFSNTLIIFTSDNGGVYETSKQWPLRAGKGAYYEGGIREPMFVIWAGKIKPGTSNDMPVTNLDFFPTIIDAIGISKPEGKILDGESIFPILSGTGKLDTRPLFWHFPIYLQGGNNETRDSIFRTRPGSVVRYGDWKLHQYFEDGGLELYNLKNDISEKHNLVGKYPGKTKKLLNMLENWRAKVNAPVPDKLNPEYKFNSLN